MADRSTPDLAGRSLPLTLLRVILATSAFLALRWYLPLAAPLIRGHGAIDATTSAFLVSFFAGVAGLPGFVAALWRRGEVQAWWIRAGLGATLVSSSTTLLWLAVSIQQVGSTLSAGTIAGQLAAPAVVAMTAVVLRLDVARITHR
ncbi:MAG: hypothetical protein HYU52_10175 [Acidobacteria bacterium]|nr:hypothetical protein [Acidobacteriota bacterium]